MSEPASAPKGFSRGLRWTLGLLATFVGGPLLLALFTLMFGSVRGREFSPDTFERREFMYLEVPLLRWQVTPILRETTAGNLEKYLQTQKFVDPNHPAPRWDLVEDNHTPGHSLRCQASILWPYLEIPSEADFWVKWSADHPQQAQALWPLVVQEARGGHYAFLPSLLLAARQTPADEHFAAKVRAALADEYQRYAETHQQLGDHEESAKAYTSLLNLRPNNAEALRARAHAYKELGKSKEAADDLAAAYRAERAEGKH